MAKLHKKGTITKNGTQGYIARMKNPKTNKFISKRAKTKDQAVQKLLEIKKIIKDEVTLKDKTLTFSRIADAFFEMRDNEYKKGIEGARYTTRVKNKSEFAAIREKFGNVKLSNMKTGFFDELRYSLGYLGEATAKNKQVLIIMIFNYAKSLGLTNPPLDKLVDNFYHTKVKSDIAHRDKKIIQHAFEPHELEIIFREIDNYFNERNLYPSLKYACYFGLFQGLRIEEIGGLHWRDIDFENNAIHIRNTATQKGGLTTYTKTKKSRRIIPILPAFLPLLKKLERDSLDWDWHNMSKDSLVLPRALFRQRKKGNFGANKLYIDATVVQEFFHIIFPKDKFPKFWKHDGVTERTIIRSHNFRRTFATNCADSGMLPQELSRILGHSKITTTIDDYYVDRFKTKEESMSIYNSYIMEKNILD